jgi:multidrug efflux pump subunit AcrA (membrane-fusion protein)
MMIPRKSVLAGAAIAIVALVLVLGLLLAGCSTHQGAGGKWHCPMHPTYISDRPGDCPICGMRLVPMKDSAAAIPPAGAKPPVDAGADKRPGSDGGAGSGASKVEGYAPVEVSGETLEAAGIRSVEAVTETLGRSVRTVGTVVPAEPEVRHIHTKIAGWVEKLDIDSTGQYVTRGEPVLAIYSPELLASQEDYLRARASAERFARSAIPEVRQGGADLVRSARRRLELFDVPESFLKQLDETGKPSRLVPVLAPISGFVTMKDIYEGQQVEPAMDLFTVSDLSRVWIEADFYQGEAPDVHVGQPARVTSPYDPALNMEGRVTYVYPYLNPESRTLRARLEFPNPGLKLKPQMFVNVAMQLEPVTGIVVPDSAVIDTGTRQIVFVDHGGGRFEPRQVTVAARADGKARIASGIAAGERVVMKANFLLDSESRLRAAIAGSAPGPGAGAGPGGAGPGEAGLESAGTGTGAGDHQHGAGR